MEAKTVQLSHIRTHGSENYATVAHSDPWMRKMCNCQKILGMGALLGPAKRILPHGWAVPNLGRSRRLRPGSGTAPSRIRDVETTKSVKCAAHAKLHKMLKISHVCECWTNTTVVSLALRTGAAGAKCCFQSLGSAHGRSPLNEDFWATICCAC